MFQSPLLMPAGCNVFSLRIQYVSLSFLCTSVHHCLNSMQQSSMSAKVCPGWLKCSATGDRLCFLVLQSERCRFIRNAKLCDVSPTYFLLHTMHVMRYTALLVLQLEMCMMSDLAPFVDSNLVVCFMWKIDALTTRIGNLEQYVYKNLGAKFVLFKFLKLISFLNCL